MLVSMSFSHNKPIGASPGHEYVLTRMVLQIIQYDTLHSVQNDITILGNREASGLIE